MAGEAGVDVVELGHARCHPFRRAPRPPRHAADDVHELQHFHIALAQAVVQVQIVGDARVLQQVAGDAGQPRRQGAQLGEVVAARGVQRLEILVQPAFHVGAEPGLLPAPALALHFRVAALQYQTGKGLPRCRCRRRVGEVARQQIVNDVPPSARKLRDGKRQQFHARHVPGQRFLRAGGAEDVRRAGEQELAALAGSELVRCLLDGGDQRRRVLELVQHHALGPQRTNESVRIVCHRSQRRLVVQRDVLQAQIAGDRPRQRRLPSLPRPGQIDDAELAEQFPDDGLQVSGVHGGFPWLCGLKPRVRRTPEAEYAAQL